MFQCDVRQKIICHHNAEDHPSNIIVYFIECIELANKTESPIENLKNIGLIFYSEFFVINLKLLSPIIIIPSSYLKKLLAYHQCNLIQDLKSFSQIKEELDNKKWSFYTYGITNDSKKLLNILSKYQIFNDHIYPYKENQKKNHNPNNEFGTCFTTLSLPNVLPVTNNTLSYFNNDKSKVFISNDSIHYIGSNTSLNLDPIQLNTNSFWPFAKPKSISLND